MRSAMSETSSPSRAATPGPMGLLLPAPALAVLAALAATGLRAQGGPLHCGYPERDILSPFRRCAEIVAPPDKQFALLRIMMSIADDPLARRRSVDGVETIEDPRWQQCKDEVDRIGLDAGHLARLMRDSRNADDRAVAHYGAFHCYNPADVFNLISHIPGEAVRRTRTQSLPRAIAYLQEHLGRTYGDLTPEQQQALKLPEPGSPAASAAGITRAPQDGDFLFQLNLKPFFQLLEQDEPVDRAQGLWFLKECFLLRRDLAVAWLEPALPCVMQLLIDEDAEVRAQAIGLLQAIGPEGLEAPPVDAEREVLYAFADEARRAMFPPIRRVGEALLLLFPSPDRDAIVAAAKQALAEGIGEVVFGKTRDGLPYRGFRVARVPEELAVLAIPEGAVITAVNGVPVNGGQHLIEVVTGQFVRREYVPDPEQQGRRVAVDRPISRKRLVVEYVLDGATHAIEYRVL